MKLRILVSLGLQLTSDDLFLASQETQGPLTSAPDAYSTMKYEIMASWMRVFHLFRVDGTERDESQEK